MSDNTPNFDAMTPEEIMAWMESLAKRQGASEGFTTAADIDVPEIDPSSVVIDEPGYVPPETSKSAKMGGKLPVSAPASRPAETKPAPAPKPVERKPEPIAPAAAKPVVPPKPAAPVAPAAVKPVEPPKPIEQPKPAAAELPLFEALKSVEPPPPPPKTEVASLSWLESLAADQSGGLPELDLSSLAADLSPVAPAPAPATNPINWLESLAQGQGAELPTPAVEPTDPMDWLESLARRQGVRDEELTTSANIDVPLPADLQIDGPGYTDYAFDVPASKPPELVQPAIPSPFVAIPEPDSAQDPAAWLDALASASSVKRAPETQSMSDTEIQAALKRGEMIPQDQMEAWMNRQLEIGAQRPEPVMEQEEAPAVKAELPDWLLEQVGQPVVEDVAPPAPSEKPPLIETILEPPPIATSEFPDWLKDDEPEASELDSIFASADTPPQETWQETHGFTPEVQAEAAVIGQGDPWFEAFEQEYQEKRGGTVEAMPATTPAPALQAAAFEPETELPEGLIEEVPDWLAGVIGEDAEAIPAEDIPDWLKQDIGGVLPVEPEPEPALVASVPDWLADVDIAAEEIPEWLTQSITGEQVSVVTPAPAAAVVPVPAQAPVPVTPVRASPAPVQVTAIDIPGTLSRARSFASGNDLDNSLVHYEQLIRANAELDTIVADMTALAEKFKTSAPILRILGDGLMRQGKLQAALDTYRKALNQL